MRIVIVAAALLTVTVSASAQTPSSRGYVEAVAASAFGNVTSQSFGGEVGVRLSTDFALFVDAGQIRDAAPAALGAGAVVIAGYLSQTQPGVSFRVKQPI